MKTKIFGIVKDSQAQQVGLKKEDIVIEYNKEAVLNPQMLIYLCSQTKPGDNVDMIVQRQGKDLHFSLKGGIIGIEIDQYYAYSLKGQTQKVAAAELASSELRDEIKSDDAAAKPGVAEKAAFGKYYALVIGNNNYTTRPS